MESVLLLHYTKTTTTRVTLIDNLMYLNIDVV